MLQQNQITAKDKNIAIIILHKTGLIAHKEEIVQSISNGRTGSIRQLTQAEGINLVSMLRHEQQKQNDSNQAITKMRGKIFYYCHQLGWTKLNKQGRPVADGQRFDEWAQKNSYLKKKLNHYTQRELPKLVSQFEQVYKHFLKSI